MVRLEPVTRATSDESLKFAKTETLQKRMSRRPAHTVVFLGAHRTDRVDFGPGPEFRLLGQQHQLAQDVDEPASRLEAALVAPARAGKSVWVLWEGASVQLLDLPERAIEGLAREELAGTLSFEAEALTGVPAADSALDGVPQRRPADALPEFRRFWVTQLSAATCDQMKAAVSRTGGRLAGIAHPGGLPLARWSAGGSSAETGEWRRIEVWDQLTFSLHGEADGSVETRVIRSTPGSEGWSSELPNEGPIAWMGPGPVTRVGPGGRRVTLFAADGTPLEPEKVDLPPDAVPVDWLRGWLIELTAQPRRVPAVMPSSGVSPNRKYYLVGGIAGWLVLMVCIGHGWMLSSQASAAQKRADQLESFRAQLTPKDDGRKEEATVTAETEKLRAKLRDLESRETALTTERDRAEKLAADLAARKPRLDALRAIHRPAIPELLAALADADRTEDPAAIVVKEVRQDGSGGIRVTGLCKHSAFADGFATRLGERLGKYGWEVGAAQKRLRDDGFDFDFSVLLTPQVLVESPPPGLASAGSAPRPSGLAKGNPAASVNSVGAPALGGPRK